MKPFITIKEIKEKLARKEVSVAEVVTFYRERIKKHNAKLNAVLEVFALRDARSDDLAPQGDRENKPTRGEEPTRASRVGTNGTLAGIPCIIKDNICQAGHVTSAGSKILANYKAPYDATVVTRLKEAGALPIGRANCDEFAMGGSGEFSAYGPTKNPWDLTRTPGGSSSGPGAAVAAGLVHFALGTETGGSVRSPATFCNLTGMYPTYGHNSRYGILAFTSSTDQVG